MSPREDPSLHLTESESTSSLDSLVKQEQKEEENVRQSTIRFGSVQVREYTRVVGDNPDVRVGAPIALGWAFVEKEAKPLDDYEQERPPYKVNLRLSSITRKNLLLNVFDVPEEEIRAAEKEVQKIQRQRDQTNKQGRAGESVEMAVQSARRKIRRRFSSDNIMKGLAAASAAMMPLSVHS